MFPPISRFGFEYDFQHYRHPQGEAGCTENYANGKLVGSKDIAKQLRRGIGHLWMREEFPFCRQIHRKLDHLSHLVE